MTPEEKLSALWAEAAPPKRDRAFAIAVMQRVERRRMLAELMDLTPLIVVLGVLAWAFAPAIEDLFTVGIANIDQMATAGIMVAAALIGGLWLVVTFVRPVSDQPRPFL